MAAANELGFIHRFIPGADAPPADAHAAAPPATAASGRAGRPTLLLLHGTGGDEDDLLPLGRALLPGAAILSPRGNVLERGMPRFFRRLAEGVFDQADLARRTEELADFVAAAAAAYGIDRAGAGVYAVGFSNGANIAASVLLRRPGLLRGAVLLSPMMPFEPGVDGAPAAPDLAGTAVFIGAGRADPIAPPAQAQRLADVLAAAGADVTVHWTAGGHGVSGDEVAAAGEWLAEATRGR